MGGDAREKGSKAAGARVTIGDMTERDWPDVRRIFEEGIATGDATFEAEAPSWEDWDRAHLAEPRLVARLNGKLAGWSALSPVSSRAVYRGVVEVSTYVGEGARRLGVGFALLTAMIERSERAGMWTLQAGVFPENAASLALHLRCGFRTVGVRERIGRMGGTWRDVVLLERRSALMGGTEHRPAPAGGFLNAPATPPAP
jgi:phosphinothricin acetyltransferase